MVALAARAFETGGEFWHDIRVYADHAFVVSEFEDHPMRVFDLSDWGGAGEFADHGYTHDTQCVRYEGPDADYQGRSLCFSSNGNFPAPNTVSTVDVTDPTNRVGSPTRATPRPATATGAG